MNPSQSLKNSFLATKFYVPMPFGPQISRPRLNALLDRSLEHPLTLISAPAGFGKTTLLAAWTQSRSVNNPLIAWLSLDEEDNEPRLFWAYVLTALNNQQPERFTPFLMHLQSPQSSPLKSLLTEFINLLAEGTDHFLLILDDYQVITEQQVHMTLAYLIEHLPAQLRIIVATRADPPLPLPLLRAREQAVEVRADQLRCTIEETEAFFREVVNIQLPKETIEVVTARMEGWLVGLQLLALSLHGRVDPATLLETTSGDQRYILDYLTEEVLLRQPQEVQTFLLSTCILERLSASLCEAVTQQTDSLQMLHRLEQANLFVISLDSKRQWYRYHALFAEALHYQLQQTHADLLPILHHRASLWYAQHDQTTQAIFHAFQAHEWEWAADLIEQKSSQLMVYAWGVGEQELALLQHWLEQLPVDIIGSRPRLCLACAYLLCLVAPYPLLDTWFDAAEASLKASLGRQAAVETSEPMLASQARQEQENFLGEVITWRAMLRTVWKDQGLVALSLCQQALALLSAENSLGYIHVLHVQLLASYLSSTNDAVTALQSGLQGALSPTETLF